MSHAAHTPALPGRRRPDMSIDWEFQPSLQHMVRRDHGGDVTWAETRPAELEPAPPRFREPLEGLSVRDIDEPEIFRAFFGDPAATR